LSALAVNRGQCRPPRLLWSATAYCSSLLDVDPTVELMRIGQRSG